MYLDTASSEPLHPAARTALLAALDRGYADPRRLHAVARDARLVLDNAREAVAEALGVRRDEVSFTTSGTDAVHRGLLGLAGPGSTVAYGAVEHSAVLHALAWRTDLRSCALPVDALGRVAMSDLDDADVVALQHANHEVGTVQPVADLGVPLFMDACASMGRLPLPEGWSAAAGSAHKWGGPAGVGVLLIRKGVPWRNPFPADDRVDDKVSGFENVPAALAAAAALQAVVAERDEVNARQRALVDRIRARVAEIPDTEVVGDPVDRLPHLVTFSFLYLSGEAVVDALGRRGFQVASGSACTASTLEPSHVLAAMGALTHGNVRVSLTRDATEADVDEFLAALPAIVAELREDVHR
ncbi:aminotransferase class V-fold PLP-dependent enzyme [uncultured Nocardioides sp.]|uniref:cysteine desulfurase family protein n=1 Tax=uncultured Nocardioides sp. TaxID=198441 RepID=UPI0026143147|nr:aminotransferase class V-fold PLP-dependent enzyme [uncultured Nocardioides sp.]